MNKLLKKRMLIISISLAFLLLINIGVSYSYYLGKVVGNESDTTIGFKSTGIIITYENNSDTIDASNVAPGWSATKNFSISSTVTENQLKQNTSNLWYEIYLYVEKNDFPSNLVTYSLSSNGNNVGNGEIAENRTNIGIPLSTELNVITIGTGNVAVGENVHNYSITFNYSNENYENGNYPDCIFNAHIKVSAIINSIINLNLDGGEIEGNTTKYVSKGGTITLQTPVKENAVFDGWIVTKGDATIIGNELTVNDAIVEVQAIWIARTIANSILNVNLDGGTWSGGDTLIQTETNSIIKLERPTKPYYVFERWEVVEGRAEISGDNIVVYDSKVVIKAIFIDMVPAFTYKKSDGIDASYIILRDDGANWRIKFLESGTLIFQSLGNIVDNKIDVFLVGGGGSGAWSGVLGNYPCGDGGGGGYTITHKNVQIQNNISIPIIIGAGGSYPKTDANGNNGETTSFMSLKAAGGFGGGRHGSGGGNGGTGGNGRWAGDDKHLASDCSDGNTTGDSPGGKGQCSIPGPNGETGTTREFGESTGDLYSYGGLSSGIVVAVPEPNNTGNGGDSGPNTSNSNNGSGGSGIVVIRNHK